MIPIGRIKAALFLLLALPVLSLIWRFFSDGLGVNPIETLLDESGQWALRTLLLTLLMTPLRRFLKQAWPIQIRRMLGLYSFFYASLHFIIFVALDKAFYWDEIIDDILERPYIMFGFAALLMLIPLAVTSTNNWIRRLGRNWQRLHRLVYPVAVFTLIHFLLLVKADITEPLIYSLIFVVLMFLRRQKVKL
jgi:sulfoxide reductase heme-binding subunit YedZ